MSQAINKLQEGGAAQKPSTKTYNYFDKSIELEPLLRSMREGIDQYIDKDLGIANRKRKQIVREEIGKAMQALRDENYNAVDLGFKTTADIHNVDKRFDPAAIAAYYVNEKMKEAAEYKEKTEEPKEEKPTPETKPDVDPTDETPIETKSKTELDLEKLKNANENQAEQKQLESNLYDEFWKNYYNNYYINPALPTFTYKYNPLDGTQLNVEVSSNGEGKDFYEKFDNYMANLLSDAYNEENGWLYNPDFESSDFGEKLNRFINLIDAQQKMYPDRTYTINDNGNTYYWQLGTEPWQENQYIWGKDADGNIRPLKMEGNAFKEYLEQLKKEMPTQTYYQDLYNKILNSVESHKEGGVLYAKAGSHGPTVQKKETTSTSQSTPVQHVAPIKGYDPQKEAATQQAIKDKAKESFIKQNQLYLYGAAADLASIALPNTPIIGTVPSALLGAIGTHLANQADYMDPSNRNWGKFATNTGYYLADAAQLIPGTNSVELSKLSKLKKIAPFILAYAGDLGAGAALTADATDVLKKLSNDQEISSEEWMHVSTDILKAIGAIMGTTRAHRNKALGDYYDKYHGTITGNNKVSVMTDNGDKVAVDSEKIQQIKDNLDKKGFLRFKKNSDINKSAVTQFMTEVGARPKTTMKGAPDITTGEVFDARDIGRINDPNTPNFMDWMKKRSESARNTDLLINVPGATGATKSTTVVDLLTEDQFKALDKTVKTKLKDYGISTWDKFNKFQNQSFNDGTLADDFSHIGINKSGGILIKAQKGTSILWRKNTVIPDSEAYNMSNWDNYYQYDPSKLIVKDITGLNEALNIQNNNSNLFTENSKYNDLGYLDWNRAFNKSGLNDLIFGYEDEVAKYYGPSTYNRHGLLTSLVKNAQADGGLKINNGTLTFDNESNQFLFTPNSEDINDVPQQEEQPVVDENLVALKGKYSGLYDRVKQLKDSAEYNPRVSSLARLIGTLHTNNVAANKSIDSLKATMRDPLNLHRQQYGDYDALSQGQLASAQMNTIAKQNLTSDAELNNRTQLEATRLGLDKEIQGKQLYNQVYRDTREKAWQAEAANKQNRNEVSFANRSNFNAIQKAKSDLDVARYLANWKSIHDYMAGREYEVKDKNDRLNQLAYQHALNQLDIDRQNDKDYLEYYRLMNNPDSSEATMNRIAELRNILTQRYGQKPYELQRELILKSKRGTKVTLKRDRIQSDRVFHKALKDTRDAHLKLLDNLSAVTKKLILKAMT